MALRLGTLGRATQQVLCKRRGRCANLHSYKTLWVMQDVCWNFLKFSIPDSACTEHTSSQQEVAGMQLCSSDVVINFLLIAKMQQHDSARETDLHFAASPNALGRVQYVLKLSLLSSCINFISRSSKRSVRNHNQGIVPQSVNLVTKTLYAKRGTFLSYKALSFSSNS